MFRLTTTTGAAQPGRHEKAQLPRYASLEQCSYELRQAEAMYQQPPPYP